MYCFPVRGGTAMQEVKNTKKPLLYYFAAIFIVLLLVTYIPAISLWLPGLLGYVK